MSTDSSSTGGCNMSSSWRHFDLSGSGLVVVDRHEAQGWRVPRHERLDLVFEERCDWLREYGRETQLAVDGAELSLTYDELDRHANQLARYLRSQGFSAGDRIAILFEDRVDSYVGLLAVLKIGATCVPLDPDAFVEQLAFAVTDSGARVVLSRSRLHGRHVETTLLRNVDEVISIDDAAGPIADMSVARLQPAERGGVADRLAYVLQVTDATGWSGAVEIDHQVLCTAVRIASETFGIGGHRIYQGQPLFTGGGTEEAWMAWAAGATLVPAPLGPPLRGQDLRTYLEERRVSAWCATPTMLSLVEPDLPGLRLVVLSREPCPPALVARWQAPRRRIFTGYVPTGATVTAAWAEADPDKPTMIGLPLPTYAAVVLDPDFPAALPRGETGEVGLAGLGLACGYSNSSGDRFEEDFLRLPGNPSGRIYRTGDLGRVDEDGEIQYRGPSALWSGASGVDVAAIESVLLAVPGVRTAAILRKGPARESTELTAYYTCFGNGPAPDEQAIRSWMSERLPTSDIPARFERVETWPMTVEGKLDRASLPNMPADAEFKRLLAVSGQLRDQVEEARDALTHPVTPDHEPVAVVEQNDAKVLEADGAEPAAADAAEPKQASGLMTLDQILAPPPLSATSPAPSAPRTPPHALPTPYPRATSPRPTPYPRAGTPRPTPYPRAGTPRPTPYPRSTPPQSPPLPASTRPALAELARTTVPTGDAAAALSVALAKVLAEVMELEHVPVDGNVFDDLGADSMVMTRFCARLRKREDLPSISIKDVYRHPTIAALAAAFGSSAPVALSARPASDDIVPKLGQVLAEVLGVGEVQPDQNVFDDLGADSMVMTRFCARLRKREDLPSISIKDVYAHPTIAALATAFASSTHVATSARVADDGVVRSLGQVLAEVLGVDEVQPDQNVFDDLGADSMVMTRFCARLRKREDLPSISIKDVYAHPTLAGMAAAAYGSASSVDVPLGRPAPNPAVPADNTPVRHSTFGYWLTGFLQLATFLIYVTGAGYVMDRAYVWISTSVGLVEIYLRSLEAGALAFLAMALLPVVAKWLLVGRWKETEFPVWSLRYFRFWLAKTLIRGNPLALLMVGSPLYSVYLRLLGAKVGKDVVILTRHVPVCTDLISIGSGTVVRKDVYLLGYRAHAGQIQQGRVTLGRDAVVGEKSVLDIGTAMGDGAQLGHASSLHRGQSVPAGERWHGTPPVPTNTDFLRLPAGRVRALRKLTFVTSQLFKLFAIYLPLGFGGLFMLLTEVPQFSALLEPGALGYTNAAFYIDALVGSATVVLVSLFLGLAIVFTLPRLAALFVRPDRVYPLYGWRYSLHRTVVRLTNIKTFVTLFGDSSYIVCYLYLLGYDLGKVEQTGSNFGSMVAQETPYLVSVGRGTVIADGLSVNNAEFSSSAFRTSRVSIGARNFLGNHIPYPTGGRSGDDCLLATKVAVPIDGPVREGVGLLGSPAFEIPRTVARDRAFEITPEARRRKLRRKNVHNAVTIALTLLVRWGHVLGLLLLGLLAVDHYADLGPVAFAAEVLTSVAFSLLWFAFWERAIVGFRPIQPKVCSIYDVRFWRHERFWKLTMPPMERLLAGTPYRNVVARMLGLRVGRRVFDDGASITERTMTTIGDDCSLNPGATIQCHSQEDGAFKSDRSALGAGVTLGVGALVHYGVSVGDAVEIEPDSFVMKGEEIPAGARWGGNPAQELDDEPAAQVPRAAVQRSAGEMPRPADHRPLYEVTV
ncbi:Pls/PosA family non-ribosomal peptide synthetase [Pseudonocardia halophobica]|uniref:Pls/PosA family non-ribosomal peptide synthetase n=1 Tax=Pseudonocardia halophobica TaxID=29401 RepID=UPI003D8B2293